MGGNNGLNRLFLHDHLPRHQFVGGELTDRLAVVFDRDWFFAFDGKTGFAQLVRQRLRINGLQKARAKNRIRLSSRNR